MILANLLRGEKVYLSALTKADAPILARWETNSELIRLSDSDPARPRTVEKITEEIDETNKRDTLFRFGIRLVEDDQLIGHEAIGAIEWQHAVGSLGIAIGDPAYWGRGFGTEAMSLLIRFGFWEINLYRIQLEVFAYNQRAAASYEKLGFIREGVKREAVQRDGQRYDLLLYGLLRPEWEARSR